MDCLVPSCFRCNSFPDDKHAEEGTQLLTRGQQREQDGGFQAVKIVPIEGQKSAQQLLPKLIDYRTMKAFGNGVYPRMENQYGYSNSGTGEELTSLNEYLKENGIEKLSYDDKALDALNLLNYSLPDPLASGPSNAEGDNAHNGNADQKVPDELKLYGPILYLVLQMKAQHKILSDKLSHIANIIYHISREAEKCAKDDYESLCALKDNCQKFGPSCDHFLRAAAQKFEEIDQLRSKILCYAQSIQQVPIVQRTTAYGEKEIALVTNITTKRRVYRIAEGNYIFEINERAVLFGTFVDEMTAAGVLLPGEKPKEEEKSESQGDLLLSSSSRTGATNGEDGQFDEDAPLIDPKKYAEALDEDEQGISLAFE